MYEKASNLPFKNNIYKNFNTYVNKYFKKEKNLLFYKDYLLEEWGLYFTNKSFYLKDVESIFRTNNELENYNRIFKHLDNMRGNIKMNLLDIKI